jgi:hypothetical protein
MVETNICGVLYGAIYFTGTVLISMIVYGCVVIYVVKNKT